MASVVSGRTPIARITMSAGYVLPDFVCTSIAPPSNCLKPATPSLSASLDAMLLHVALDEARDLRVQRGQDVVEASG